MPHRNGREEFGGLAALTLVGQVGLAVALPILAGVALGVYLDGIVQTGGLIVAGMILAGIVGGVAGAYRIIASHLD